MAHLLHDSAHQLIFLDLGHYPPDGPNLLLTLHAPLMLGTQKVLAAKESKEKITQTRVSDSTTLRSRGEGGVIR